MRKVFSALTVMIFVGIIWHGVLCWRDAYPVFSVFSEKLQANKSGWVQIQARIIKIPSINTQHHFVSLWVSWKGSVLKLSEYRYYGSPVYHVGDVWRWHVKLKPLRALHNIGVTSYVERLKQAGVVGKGTISSKEKKLKLSEDHFSIVYLREILLTSLKATGMSAQSVSVIGALLLGDKSKLSYADRKIFQKTATSHLMAISGLHVGMVALYLYLLFRWLFGLFGNQKCGLYRTPRHCALSLSFIGAVVYALLSGFAVSTQRALLMLFFVNWALQSGRSVFKAQIWILSCICIVLWNPFSWMEWGFWLSFGLVFYLLLASVGYQSRRGKLFHFFWPQWVVFLVSIPIGFYAWQYFLPLGFIVNLVMIPFVSLILLPFLFVVSFFSIMGVHLWWIADILVHDMMLVLQWSAHWVWFFRVDAVYSWIGLVLGLLGVAWLILPVNIWIKIFGFLLLVLPYFQSFTFLKRDEVLKIVVFDVGQGLAIYIQTAHHNLLYDTGRSFSGGGSVAESTLIPFLKQHRIFHIHQLLISHFDDDHSGGMKDILDQLHVEQYGNTDQICREGREWHWDGVTFMALNDMHRSYKKRVRNNQSCVLKIIYHHHSVLLTGDIEAPAESYLVSYHRYQLRSDVLIAPHHGSKSSSTAKFIEAVKPKYVIFSTGYKNRYRHPSAEVVKRYQRIHAMMLNTAYDGMISFRFLNVGNLLLKSYFEFKNE